MILSLYKGLKKKIKLFIIHRKYKSLSIIEVFNKIYKENAWDKNSINFNSGPGSHNQDLVIPYVEFVNSFIKKTNINSILDLGCGDFNIGKNIYQNVKKYIGIDIVHDLIEINKKKFNNDIIHFECKDFIEESLPKAECIIIRQVMQHLDNKSIFKILNKISDFKYVVITEHIPKNKFIANVDKSIGPTTRLEFNSGIEIESKPFNFLFKEKKEISIDDNELGGRHKTVIYTL